ncbi:DUF305 domain-containing protein [Microbacterium invictum]
MKKFRMAAFAAAPIALALVLAGCSGTGNDSGTPGTTQGGGSSASPSVTVQGDFNMADSMFAMMMIPHHEQAIEMSDVILTKNDIDQRVLELAQQVKDAQGPEIELMQSWLDAWGVPSSGNMGGMDHGDGMMSQEDMGALDAADGPEAARLFLEQMIMHHEGAIEMAQAELEDGTNPDALALAQTIIDAQNAEIATMQDLLTRI